MKHTCFKRLVSMLVSVAMLCSFLPTTFAAEPSQFSDFPQGWSREAMTFGVENGLINGKSSTTIEPASNLTRAEMATIINRAFGAEIAKDISEYKDVNPDDWFYDEIGKAVNMETFHGDGNGLMRPNDFITREEVMAVLARALVIESDDYTPIEKFGDYSSVSDWAKPELSALIGEGYVDGYEDGTLRPKSNITREEFVQLMYNIFKTYFTAQGSYNKVSNPDCVMINQPDIVLSDVTIEGDLVLGDGVGSGRVNLKNVTIKGRLLARGGFITLENVTADKGVVVKNVNGRTHFFNWRTDKIFDGVRELTYTTYLTSTVAPGVGGTTGGGGGSSSTKKADYTIEYYFQSAQNLSDYIIDTNRTFKGSAKVDTIKTAEIPEVEHYVYNDKKSTPEIKIKSKNNELKIYYDLIKYQIEYTKPDGTKDSADVAHGQKLGDALDVPAEYTDNDGNKFRVEWDFTDDKGNIEKITPDTTADGSGTLKPVLYAKVKFDLNYPDSVPVETEIEKDKTISDKLPENPVRDDYNFRQWNTKPDGSGEVITADTVVSKPLDVYAIWDSILPEPVYRTVTFMYNYEDAPSEYYKQYTDVLDGSKITAPAAPARLNYEFGGWYKDADCTVAFDFASEYITDNTVIYAKWTPYLATVHTIYFNANNGTALTTVSVEEGKTLARPTDPLKDGHSFDGWYKDILLTEKYDFSIPVTSSFTLYAKWKENPPSVYTVVFDTNGGTVIESQTVVSGSKATRPENDPEKDGFNFAGWFEDKDCTVPYDFNKAVTGNITIYANWAEIIIPEYDVVFDTNGGSDVQTQIVKEGDKATKPADPTKEGHKFAGWYTDTTYETEYDFNTPITSDTTIHAKWIVDVYEIKFDSKGGSAVASQNVEYGMLVSEPDEPELSGYNFAGWTTDGTTLYDFSQPVKGPFTLYAKWDVIPIVTHTVSFETYGGVKPVLGTPYEPKSVEDGKLLKNVADPVKDGHDFEGWFTDEQFSTKYDFNTPVTADFTLYAKWKAHTFNITFESNGGSEVAGQVVEYGKCVAEPEAPERSGHKFMGWYEDNTFKTPYDFTSQVKSDLVLFAKWEVIVPNKYVVTFVNEGSSYIPSQSITEGEKVNKPSAPKRTGYTFGGWYTDTNYTRAYDFTLPVTSSFTLYAKWDINKYKITFETNGGSNVNPILVPYNTTATEPEAPVKDGYEFAGWYKNEACTVLYDFSQPVIKEFTLYAKWNVVVPNKYTVSFRSNGGSSVASQRIVENDKVVRPAAPTKTGYTFDDWYSDSKLTVKYDFDTPVKESFILYAGWIANKYNVTFESNGGSPVPVQTVEYGNRASEPEQPEKEGYTFKGWYTDPGLSIGFSFNNAYIMNDITLYAKWELNVYAVKFDTDGGTEIADANVNHGDKVAKPADPEKIGYTFKGWYTDDSYTTEFSFDTAITKGITVYAKFDINVYTVEFDTDGGTEIADINVNHGDKVAKPAAPEKTGYTFKGWYTDDSYTTEFSFDTAITKGITVYAKFDINVYTVKFDTDGGTEIADANVNHGDKVAKPADPEKDGFVFAGWYLSDDSEYDFETAVTNGFTLYAKWESSVEKFDVVFYYGVNESNAYVGEINDVTAGSSITAEEYEKIYADEGIIFEDEGVPGYTDGSYTHMIYPELRYMDASGKWNIFDETTKIVSDMKVYYTFKYIQLTINSEFLGVELNNVSLYTYYESDTRFMDSLKDFMTTSRNPINNGLKGKDGQIYKKLADSTGFVDENGYVLIKAFGLNIAEIIDIDDIEGEIENYIKNHIASHRTDVEAVVDMIKLEDIIALIGDESITDRDGAVDYIISIQSDEAKFNEISNGIISLINEYDYYKNFLSSFEDKKDTYTVDKENIKLVKAVAHAVKDFESNDIIARLRKKGFGAFINLYGEEKFAQMFVQSQTEYFEGLEEVAQSIESEEITSAQYTTKMNVRVNLAEIFGNVANKFKNKYTSKFDGKSYYTENAYLREFVEQDIMESLFDYEASAVSDTNSGYKLKPIMTYYDNALENLILFDKALLWYGELSEEERDAMRNEYAADMITMQSNIGDMLNNAQNGGAVVGDNSLADIASKLDSVESMLDKMGGGVFGSMENDIRLMIEDIKEEIAQIEATGETPTGFTLDELKAINNKLSAAYDAYGKKDFDTANDNFADAIATVLNKMVELAKEMNENGTVNGDDYREKISHIPVINRIYDKFSIQIDDVISRMATGSFAKEYTKESVLETFDVKRIEDILIGHDTEERYTIDTFVDYIVPFFEDTKVDSPEHSADEIVIDHYESESGNTIMRRYLY